MQCPSLSHSSLVSHWRTIWIQEGSQVVPCFVKSCMLCSFSLIDWRKWPPSRTASALFKIFTSPCHMTPYLNIGSNYKALKRTLKVKYIFECFAESGTQ